MNTLTFEEIVELHDESIRIHGGTPGILNEIAIRSAVAAPLAGFGDYERYPSIIEKATVLCFSLVKGHGFQDGNKRVGFFALLTLLANNGYLLETSNQEAQEFILALASGKKTKEELLSWVQSRVQTAPFEPVAGELSYGGDLVLSQQAQQIQKGKPAYWEAKLFAQVVTDEIAKSANKRLEHQQSISSYPKVTFSDHHQFFRWMSSQADIVANEIGRQAEIINFLGNEISNSTRENQNDSVHEEADLGLALAVELGAIYRATLERCLYFRSIEMTEEYQPLLNAWASYFDGYIENLETSPARYLAEIATAEFSEDEGTHRATITIDMTAKDSGSLHREIKELKTKLGLGNENEPDALERVNEAIEVATALFHRQMKIITDYSYKVSQVFSNLEKVSGLPKHISIPRTKAIHASLIQRNHSLDKDLKLTLSEFESAVKICEDYAQLVVNVFDPNAENYEESARISIIDLQYFQDVIEEFQSTTPIFKEGLEIQTQLSDKITSSCEELIATYDVYDALLSRFANSLKKQADAIERAIPL